MECFAFVWFCMFCHANIWQKIWEHFSHSGPLLILAQIFALCDCLQSSCCNLPCKCSVIDLNSGTFLSLYLGPFSQERIEHVFSFSAGFCILQRVTCRGVFIFHIFKLKKQLFACEEKTCLSEQKFVKKHEAAHFCVCREPYQSRQSSGSLKRIP